MTVVSLPARRAIIAERRLSEVVDYPFYWWGRRLER